MVDKVLQKRTLRIEAAKVGLISRNAESSHGTWNHRSIDSTSSSFNSVLLSHPSEVAQGPRCAMSSPPETAATGENLAPSAPGGDHPPQSVEPTAPTAGPALVADVRSFPRIVT